MCARGRRRHGERGATQGARASVRAEHRARGCYARPATRTCSWCGAGHAEDEDGVGVVAGRHVDGAAILPQPGPARPPVGAVPAKEHFGRHCCRACPAAGSGSATRSPRCGRRCAAPTTGGRAGSACRRELVGQIGIAAGGGERGAGGGVTPQLGRCAAHSPDCNTSIHPHPLSRCGGGAGAVRGLRGPPRSQGARRLCGARLRLSCGCMREHQQWRPGWCAPLAPTRRAGRPARHRGKCVGCWPVVGSGFT